MHRLSFLCVLRPKPESSIRLPRPPASVENTPVVDGHTWPPPRARSRSTACRSAGDKRAVVYQRAKNVLDKRPFGTQYDNADGFEWLRHSIAPRPHASAPFRVTIGGPDCAMPYCSAWWRPRGTVNPGCGAGQGLCGQSRRSVHLLDQGPGHLQHRHAGGDRS